MDFAGEFEQRLDGKGRVSIPAAFRAVLEAHDPDWNPGGLPRLVLQYHEKFDGHLRVYSLEEIERIRRGITRMTPGAQQKGMRKMFLLKTLELGLDRDGRIVIPQRQREKLGLQEGMLAFLGYGAHFEIWPQAAALAAPDKADEWIMELGEDVDPLSYLPAEPDPSG